MKSLDNCKTKSSLDEMNKKKMHVPLALQGKKKTKGNSLICFLVQSSMRRLITLKSVHSK